MKTFKFLAALLLAVVYVGLASCSKDDGGKNDNGLLVGTWETSDKSKVITFNADGSGIDVDDGYEPPKTRKFNYTLDSKTMKLTVRFDKPEPGDPAEATSKVEINGDELKVGDLVYHRKK